MPSLTSTINVTLGENEEEVDFKIWMADNELFQKKLQNCNKYKLILRIIIHRHELLAIKNIVEMLF